MKGTEFLSKYRNFLHGRSSVVTVYYLHISMFIDVIVALTQFRMPMYFIGLV